MTWTHRNRRSGCFSLLSLLLGLFDVLRPTTVYGNVKDISIPFLLYYKCCCRHVYTTTRSLPLPKLKVSGKETCGKNPPTEDKAVEDKYADNGTLSCRRWWLFFQPLDFSFQPPYTFLECLVLFFQSLNLLSILVLFRLPFGFFVNPRRRTATAPAHKLPHFTDNEGFTI